MQKMVKLTVDELLCRIEEAAGKLQVLRQCMSSHVRIGDGPDYKKTFFSVAPSMQELADKWIKLISGIYNP